MYFKWAKSKREGNRKHMKTVWSNIIMQWIQETRVICDHNRYLLSANILHTPRNMNTSMKKLVSAVYYLTTTFKYIFNTFTVLSVC